MSIASSQDLEKMPGRLALSLESDAPPSTKWPSKLGRLAIGVVLGIPFAVGGWMLITSALDVHQLVGQQAPTAEIEAAQQLGNEGAQLLAMSGIVIIGGGAIGVAVNEFQQTLAETTQLTENLVPPEAATE